MFCGALSVAEHRGAGLDPKFSLKQFSQFVGRAREDGMAESIEMGCVCGDLATGAIFDAFTDYHDAVSMRLNRFFDLREELFFFKGTFRQQDDMRRICGIATFGE